MVKAVFAGSFDPPTNGHLDIIKRASGLFESVDVVVSVNPEKHTMFSEEERVQFLKELIKPFNNVSVHSYKGIIVNYAKEHLPEEACGLLAGVETEEGRVIQKVYFLENKDHAEDHFMLDPRDQMNAIKDMRANGFRLLRHDRRWRIFGWRLIRRPVI